MNNKKISIALSGASIATLSIFAPQELIAYGMVAIGSTVIALTLMPLLSFFINPIVEKTLKTKFGLALGKRGRHIFRILFAVPSLPTFNRKRG